MLTYLITPIGIKSLCLSPLSIIHTIDQNYNSLMSADLLKFINSIILDDRIITSQLLHYRINRV